MADVVGAAVATAVKEAFQEEAARKRLESGLVEQGTMVKTFRMCGSISSEAHRP